MKTYLFITIDTEEDLWGEYAVKHPSVENIKKIHTLQEIFAKYNAVPTYLINYPVATDAYSIDVLSGLLQKKRCDIGTHCHPWNTPPFHDEGVTERHSYMCNLPEKLILDKMAQLHNAIKKNFHFTPTVFRAGRWGVGPNVIRTIKMLGYQIDTSLHFMSWEKNSIHKICINKYETVYSEGSDIFCGRLRCNMCNESKYILEIPPTIGFLQNNFLLCNKLKTLIQNSFLRRFRLIGVLDRLRLLNFRVLSPEISSFEDMVKLSKAMMKNGYKYLNLTFHSTSLIAGKSPFVNNEHELDQFLKKIERYLEFLKKENVICIGMSKAREVLT